MKPPQKNQVICGSNLEVTKPWPSNCIDAICTDPPYGLGFMGKEWDTLIEKTRDNAGGFLRDDKSGSNPYAAARCRHGSDSYQMQEWYYQWALAMLRIIKPGGFLLCFGGTRTYHRLACAIEDAGWEIRDCMMWFYGSGFPKSHNISKAIDKAKGAERKVTKIRTDGNKGGGAKTYDDDSYVWDKQFAETAPTTNLAQLWDGYGTALKPAWEPIIVAMKPLDGTFAHNAEKHGVAGLNIDEGRIRHSEKCKMMKAQSDKESMTGGGKYGQAGRHQDVLELKPQGRWPANLILDEEAGAMLDEQSGKRGGCKPHHIKASEKTKKVNKEKGWGSITVPDKFAGFNDSGGASRFFYCAKTSRKERNMGMENCEDKLLARSGGAQGAENRGEKEYLQKHIGLNRVAVVKNNHPTVKPLALMKYLCTLLKMPGSDQIILDPFLGSGTTAMACASLGIGFIGIEKELEYCQIAVKRIAAISGETLPVTKNVETFRAAIDFAGGSRRPNENLPRVSESRQSIINAASAELRRNQK